MRAEYVLSYNTTVRAACAVAVYHSRQQQHLCATYNVRVGSAGGNGEEGKSFVCSPFPFGCPRVSVDNDDDDDGVDVLDDAASVSCLISVSSVPDLARISLIHFSFCQMAADAAVVVLALFFDIVDDYVVDVVCIICRDLNTPTRCLVCT